MYEYYSKQEKVAIIVDIAKKLKTFPTSTGGTKNLYNDNYLFLDRFKKITMDWINNEKSKYNGMIYFEELNKYFEYDFPDTKKKEPLFVLRNNKFLK